ncbi:hypothetical protein DFH06DRAFT_1305252 [Mycena polygramma]|nr:hypothetical protein DFH06DRAFT_1305252 [Mycena polygramma]
MSVPSTVSRRGRATSQSDPNPGPPTQRRRLTADPPVEDPSFNSIDYRVCFLQVEDHLFQVCLKLRQLMLVCIHVLMNNIHLYHLLQDADSVFRNMLTMPTGGAAPEGFERSNPVVLQGDSLAHVRAFHRIVYNSPLDSQFSAFQLHDLQMLADAGLFAHKYSMTTVVVLVLGAIQRIGTRHSFDLITPDLASAFLQLTLLRGSNIYDRTGTLEHTIRELVRRSWMLRIHADPSFDKLREMLDIAEQYDFRPLLGELYYLYLHKITLEPREASHDPGQPPFPDPSLSELHRSRILMGNWSLENCWHHFTTSAPPVPVGFCAYPDHHAGRCDPHWDVQWRAAVDAPAVRTIRSVDIFRKLAKLHQSLEATYEDSQFCFRKAFGGLHPVSEYSRKLRESLADHFMGPP